MRLDAAGIALAIRSARSRPARCFLAAASGLAVVLAAGCSSPGSPGGPVSGTITIAAVPGVDDAPLYLAQKEKLFAAEGLSHVVIKTFQSPTAELSALQNASVDIAAADYGNIFYQQTQSPHNLRILADGYDATQGMLEVLTLPGSSIKSPADLVSSGVKVGLPEDDVVKSLMGSGYAPSLEAAAASSVLSNFVANAALGVNWDPMPQSQEVTELENHQVQAILVGEPYIYQAESAAGAVALMDASSVSANLPLSGYVATAAWVKQNGAAVADFRAALSKAQSDAGTTGVIQKLLPSATGMSVQDADMITLGTYPTSTSFADLETVLYMMTNTHMIKSAPSLGSMLVSSKS